MHAITRTKPFSFKLGDTFSLGLVKIVYVLVCFSLPFIGGVAIEQTLPHSYKNNLAALQYTTTWVGNSYGQSDGK